MQTININLLKANVIMSNVENQTTVDKCLLLDNEEFMGTFMYEINAYNKDGNKSIDEITETLIEFVNNNY